MEMPTDPAGSPLCLPAQGRGKEVDRKFRAAGTGQALGTPHMAPAF